MSTNMNSKVNTNTNTRTKCRRSMIDRTRGRVAFCLAVFSVFTLLPFQVFAHGENKPGPNGGFIQMPGAFHTELILDEDDGSFHLFLLDMNFKNPTAQNSSVQASLDQKKKPRVNFKCEVMGGNHYHCKPDKKYAFNSGQITLNVKRKGASAVAVYNLPLARPKEAPSHHH